MKFKLFLFTSAALLPIAAQAQSDVDYGAVPDQDIVVVAAGVEQDADETGRSVTLVGRAEIEARQTIAVTDLLATTPGLAITRSGGIGALTGVQIRGADATQTLVLIDGVRVNDSSSPGGGFDFGNLLAGAVDRVEVLRGPNSVAWGSQAIGGVVNVVTVLPSGGLAMRSNVEVGSFDQVNANAMLAGGNRTVRAAVTAGYLNTDGISQAAVGTEPDGYRQFNTTGRVSIDFAPGFGLDLRTYYTQSRLDLDGFTPSFTFGDTDEYSQTEETYGYAGLHADIGPVRNRVSFTLADINRDNYATASSTGPSFFARGRTERYAYQGDAGIGEVARIVIGAEQEDSRFTDGSTTASQGITSFYGEAILDPADFATLTLGARNDDHSGFGSHWSFGANAAVRPMKGMVLRASYGEGFKAPTLYQRFSDYGTPGLEPETATTYEIGAEQTIVDGVKVGATWFHRDTRNQIDFISCPATQVTDPATICYQRPFGTYDNIARTRAEGVEVEVVAQPVTGLSLRGSYTHLDAENRSDGANFGNDLARRPQDAGSLSADYRFGFGGSLGGSLLIVGPSFDNAGNTLRLDGYSVASVRAALPISPNAEFYGRVENLFDESYQTVSGYGTYGRTAYAGLRLRFD
jgi:vitamin B12 transporter